MKLCPEELRQQFLRCDPADNAPALSGELERIIFRCTRTEDGSHSDGFGQHHVDWGLHLAPGWQENRTEGQEYQPAQAEDGCFWQGTVERLAG